MPRREELSVLSVALGVILGKIMIVKVYGAGLVWKAPTVAFHPPVSSSSSSEKVSQYSTH